MSTLDNGWVMPYMQQFYILLFSLNDEHLIEYFPCHKVLFDGIIFQ